MQEGPVSQNSERQTEGSGSRFRLPVPVVPVALPACDDGVGMRAIEIWIQAHSGGALPHDDEKASTRACCFSRFFQSSSSRMHKKKPASLSKPLQQACATSQRSRSSLC